MCVYEVSAHTLGTAFWAQAKGSHTNAWDRACGVMRAEGGMVDVMERLGVRLIYDMKPYFLL
jgi:hypothetical protein